MELLLLCEALVDSEGDTPRLFGIRPSGEQVDVAGMSEGSRDQLYLALRLAALELQVEQGLNMPLVADDLFINFDDRRTAAGLKVLGDLSRSMQVIFLTHHDHLVPVAKEVLGQIPLSKFPVELIIYLIRPLLI